MVDTYRDSKWQICTLDVAGVCCFMLPSQRQINTCCLVEHIQGILPIVARIIIDRCEIHMHVTYQTILSDHCGILSCACNFHYIHENYMQRNLTAVK